MNIILFIMKMLNKSGVRTGMGDVTNANKIIFLCDDKCQCRTIIKYWFLNITK